MNDYQREWAQSWLNDTTTMDITTAESNNLSSNVDDTITLTTSPYIFAGGSGTMGASVLTAGSNGTVNWNSSNLHGSPMVVNQSGTIALKGENADIKINDVSLNETLQAIQDRLNILKPNKELEAEWDQLRELGEQYRKLETEFKEKTKMWKTLKAMPPPEIE
jgi:hypothetical protein